ncbi:MAG: hypothetical protein KAT65_17550, partial [Methanophagales archaeon]|nr:hypothetical protein [Methanophagales archaeon]
YIISNDMTDKTKRKFINLVTERGTVDSKEIEEFLGVGRRQVYNIIKFFEEKRVVRQWRSTRTFVHFYNPIVEKEFKDRVKLTDAICPIPEKETPAVERRKNIKLCEGAYNGLKEIKPPNVTWDDWFLEGIEATIRDRLNHEGVALHLHTNSELSLPILLKCVWLKEKHH